MGVSEGVQALRGTGTVNTPPPQAAHGGLYEWAVIGLFLQLRPLDTTLPWRFDRAAAAAEVNGQVWPRQAWCSTTDGHGPW